MHKFNTTAYYPQCDGLVENLNKTLRALIAKHTKDFGVEWVPYHSKPHAFTKELSFYLIYGRHPEIPPGGMVGGGVMTTGIVTVALH